MNTTTELLPSNSRPGSMLSAYQSNIVRFVRDERGSACVIAVAGSGKTFTIEECLYVVPETAHVQLFAFNASIAKELNVRLDRLREKTGKDYRNMRASTFHSVGVGAIARKLDKRVSELQSDSSKVYNLAKEWLADRRHQKTQETLLSMYGTFCSKLVGHAKGQGIGCLVKDTDDAWYDIIRHHDLYLDSTEATEEEALFIARGLLKRSNDAALTGYIDFDDMLYLPLLWKLRLWQNDFVFVDEAQDTNPVRRAMIRLCLKPGGRMIAVGDPRQAIYGFTGATDKAIDVIKHDFRAVELPLTVSYRCPRAVVEFAQQLVSHIESHPDAPEGVVDNLKLRDALPRLGNHDAILCRNTAPLISLAFGLIGRGRACVVLGREIGQGLVTIIKKMKAGSIDALEAKLEAFRAREFQKFMDRNETTKAEAINDRILCITTFIENLDENNRTIPALIDKITGLFSDTNGVLTLATIHKAKGKEWDRVAVLRPELMPSPFARQEWQVRQEQNVEYVARTRAMAELYYLTDDVLADPERKAA